MPRISQGYCGDGRGLSGLHWVCFNGRGPHLGLRQEPQVSSPFLTQIEACCRVGIGYSGLVLSESETERKPEVPASTRDEALFH